MSMNRELNLDLGKRIASLRKSRDMEQKEVAEALGLAYHTYQHYEYGYHPSRKNIELILSFYGCSRSWLLTGEGEPYPAGSTKYQEPTIPYSPDSGFKAREDEFVMIPRFEDKISAGGGLIPTNHIEDIRIAFRREWIQRKGNPEKMSIIQVSGDSMVPTLLPGDLVLINHGHNHVDPQGGIYAVALDDHILIKRLQVIYPNGKMRIISDNNKYASVEVPCDQVKINGKVIWYAREI